MPKKFLKRVFPKKKKGAKKALEKKVLSIVHKDGMKGPVHKFIRSIRQAAFLYNPSAVLDQAFAFQFTLNDVPNVSEFTVLYDSYCISKVIMICIPVGNTGITNATNNQTSTIAHVIDYDDANVPSTMNELMQYAAVKVRTCNTQFSISLIPRVAVEIYKTAVTTGYGVGPEKAWLDCANADIPHYGIKMVMTPGSAAFLSQYQVYFKYYLEFRGIR